MLKCSFLLSHVIFWARVRVFCTWVDFEGGGRWRRCSGVDWKALPQLLNCTNCTKWRAPSAQVHQTACTTGGNATLWCWLVHPRRWSNSNAQCLQSRSQKEEENLENAEKASLVDTASDWNTFHCNSNFHNWITPRLQFDQNVRIAPWDLQKN